MKGTRGAAALTLPMACAGSSLRFLKVTLEVTFQYQGLGRVPRPPILPRPVWGSVGVRPGGEDAGGLGRHAEPPPLCFARVTEKVTLKVSRAGPPRPPILPRPLWGSVGRRSVATFFFFRLFLNELLCSEKPNQQKISGQFLGSAKTDPLRLL